MKIFKNVLFYLASFTWGICLTLPGSLVALVLLMAGFKPRLFHNRVYFLVGNNWGGFGMGPFIVLSNSDDDDFSKCHEAGHGLQNLIFGPIQVFISLASVFRYHYRNWYIAYRFNKTQKPLRSYYAIWFEHQANVLGSRYTSDEKVKEYLLKEYN